MTDEAPDHRAGWIIAAATIGSMLAALILYAGLWMVTNPGTGIGDAVGQVASSPRGSDLLSAFLAAGGLAGFLSSSFALGVPAIRRIVRTVAGLGLFAVGGLVGGFFGMLAYLGYWLGTHPTHGVVESLARLPQAYGDPQDPLGAFLLAGAMAGLAGAAYVLGAHLMRRMVRSTAGAVLGGVAGLSLFSMATVILSRPAGGPEGVMVAFAQAVYSFSPLEAIFVAVGASVGFLMARYSWRLYGLFTFVALVSVVLGYLVYTMAVTLPRVPASNFPVALILFAAETATLVMVVLYSFYTLDVASRKRWRRGPQGAVFSRFFMPNSAHNDVS